jgi:phage shock protein PspC (stress-responsive transcriptional regulator)
MTNATTPQPNVNDASLAGARAWFAQRGLSRPREGRLLAGVAAAFARRYDVNPLVARIATVAIVLTLTPLVYVAAWILMPGEAAAEQAPAAPAAA